MNEVKAKSLWQMKVQKYSNLQFQDMNTVFDMSNFFKLKLSYEHSYFSINLS